ncbi:MAG TPA: FAD-dependent oxidoreductase [Haloplasmataceae bacterium]
MKKEKNSHNINKNIYIGGNFLWICHLIFPKLKKDLTVDILIVGGNLSGLLNAYFLNEKGVKIVVIDREKIIYPDHFTSIDKDVNKLMSNLDPLLAMNFFPFFLESLYRLKDIVNKLELDCDFSRKPFIAYKDESERDAISIPFTNNILSYYSGTYINEKAFMNELIKYFMKQKIPIYENSPIESIDIDDTNISVKTLAKYKINCKKVIFTSIYESALFFDKPKQTSHITKHHLYQVLTNYHQQMLIDSNNQVSLDKFYLAPVIKNEVITYQFHKFFNLKEDIYLYIDIEEECPNIYYHLGSTGLFSSLAGALALSNKYFGIDDKYMDLLKCIK